MQQVLGLLAGWSRRLEGGADRLLDRIADWLQPALLLNHVHGLMWEHAVLLYRPLTRQRVLPAMRAFLV
jgi:hypothetical protein